MTETTLYITIAVKVKSDLPIEEVIDEFGSECSYDFSSTNNVKVVNQEWLDTTTDKPNI